MSMTRTKRSMAHTLPGLLCSRRSFLGLSASVVAAMGCGLSGCGRPTDAHGVSQIEVVTYKPEAVKIFDALEERFNSSHDDIKVSISCPNDATTVLKTRFIRGNYPDIIAIGGDITYSDFVEAGVLRDLSDYPRFKEVKQSYTDILETLEYVPTRGSFGVPYMSNAAGILYNRAMFKERGWDVPGSWSALMALCEQIRGEGVLPFYLGLKDTWTCLAPWNALAVELAPTDLYQQVNEGRARFSEYYRDPAEKLLKIVSYAQEGPVAYGYNNACTAFAKGESAMYPIGSYAIPQILSVNPDLDIDSFVMPGSDDPSQLVLNSGVDLQLCVTTACEDVEGAYKVLDFLTDAPNIQTYIDDQIAVPCLNGDFRLSGMLDGMRSYIDGARVADYQDHHYPSEMSVDAMIQAFVIDGDVDAFLSKFDTDWKRYNRDVIRKVQEYEQTHGKGGADQ